MNTKINDCNVAQECAKPDGEMVMSEFVEVKTAELIGPALDWAVGVADGNPMRVPVSDVVWSDHHGSYSPSINWAQCGPLFDKHCSALNKSESGWWTHAGNRIGEGETAMVAICRAIVATKFGDVAQVPAGMVEGL